MNRLDWYILNGFVLDEMLRLADEIKSGIAFGRLNWAYILSGGKYMSTLAWRAGLVAARFTVNWVLAPILAAFAYYYGNITIAFWIFTLFGVLVVFRIILLPRRFLTRRAQKRRLAELEDKLGRLIQIHLSCHTSTLNPTVLRERIAEAERGETLVRPAAYSILDRAISRDPAVFTMRD